MSWYHVAIDLDDVVLDFCGGLVTAVRKEFGVDLTHEQLIEWDLDKVLSPIIGRPWGEWLKDRDWLWSHFDAVDGAIGGIEKLRRRGLYLELLTVKPEWAEYAVWRWLGKWRPRFNRVTLVAPDHTKVDYTEAQLLVDDRPENCLEFVEAGRTAILFDRPWNRTFGPPVGMVRAGSWNEVVEAVLIEASIGGLPRRPKAESPARTGWRSIRWEVC